MRIGFAKFWPRLILFSALLEGPMVVNGQGTITFDGHSLWSGKNYTELGMQFQVVIPQGSAYDDMVVVPANWANNVPQDNTPFMGWFRQYNPSDYVAFNLINGDSFGLTSVQLADPNSPSSTPVPIMFVGSMANGSTVTNIFTTPGGGATTFQNYLFTSAFTSGLSSVAIQSTQWAMDNLVFGNVSPIPEPGVGSLIAVGLLAFAARKIQARRESKNCR